MKTYYIKSMLGGVEAPAIEETGNYEHILMTCISWGRSIWVDDPFFWTITCDGIVIASGKYIHN